MFLPQKLVWCHYSVVVVKNASWKRTLKFILFNCSSLSSSVVNNAIFSHSRAIRHPASGYVQGINDLATPFLVVFLSEHLEGSIDTWSMADLSSEKMLNVEADSYWCLSKLLDGMQDHYTFAQPGIQRLVFKLKELVRRIDGMSLIVDPFTLWLLSNLKMGIQNVASSMYMKCSCIENPTKSHFYCSVLTCYELWQLNEKVSYMHPSVLPSKLVHIFCGQ